MTNENPHPTNTHHVCWSLSQIDKSTSRIPVMNTDIIPLLEKAEQQPHGQQGPLHQKINYAEFIRADRRVGANRRRWIRVANGLIVGVIVYFLLIVFLNFRQQPCMTRRISNEEAEHIMLNTPSPGYIRNQSEWYTSGPHIAGKNYSQAIYTRDLWESYGIPSKIEEYEVLLNYPLSHRLALLDGDKVKYEAELREDVIPEDPTSADPDVIPTFHGYSAAGNVTGELVYANFGHIDDFRMLERKGVNISGKIVIVRYGTTFRGLKVKAAQGPNHFSVRPLIVNRIRSDRGHYIFRSTRRRTASQCNILSGWSRASPFGRPTRECSIYIKITRRPYNSRIRF